MHEIAVEVDFDAPQAVVFDAVSDHVAFLSGEGAVCRLTREGNPDRNGLGAVREVQVGALNFAEEIVAFDRPRRFDYVITRLVGKSGRPLPIKHDRGWLAFQSADNRTHVEWRTRFSVPIPLVGWLMERVIGMRMAPLFRAKLLKAKARLEASPQPARETHA